MTAIAHPPLTASRRPSCLPADTTPHRPAHPSYVDGRRVRSVPLATVPLATVLTVLLTVLVTASAVAAVWWLRRRWTDRRWLVAPVGCCTCGTGGPYYAGDAPAVTRFLYGDATLAGDGISCDWSACSRHALTGPTPVVDYGADVVVALAQTVTDFAHAITPETTR